jgi:serine/threonine-protein kinase
MSDGEATAKKSGAPDPLLGRVIADRFRIVGLIARGGMGKVYRAEQAPLGRLCAVKVLNPNYSGDADPEFHRRFFREASTASKITHPNSVTIFDYGRTDDDVYYMAMEYLEGQTLHHALREGGVMHEERVGRIAQQICRALREAHATGVIHRDLKPANIFLTRHGDDDDFVKVLDFGLVKHIGERPEEQLTQTGLFMGSPKYMAPEQIQGGQVDARTDIYSLGIILYEMLAGKVPFERATSVNILMAHVGEPPPPMREVNPNLQCSPAFEDLVMRCIAKDPDQRFSSMDEVLQWIKRAHGTSSMTGQLAAVNVTGPFPPASSNRPPPVSASGSMAPQIAPSVISGSHTPPGYRLLRTSEHAILDGFEPRPRSKAWIALGVLVAAAVGGGMGMLLFRMTAPEPTVAMPSSAPPAVSAEPPAAAPSSSAPTAPPLAPRVIESAVPLKVLTDPTGATVRDETEVSGCDTPCDLPLKGPGQHRITVSKVGFKSETRTVKQGDPPLHVRLTKLAGGAIVRPPAPPAPPKQDPPPPPKAEPTTPSGFKDLPY